MLTRLYFFFKGVSEPITEAEHSEDKSPLRRKALLGIFQNRPHSEFGCKLNHDELCYTRQHNVHKKWF